LLVDLDFCSHAGVEFADSAGLEDGAGAGFEVVVAVLAFGATSVSTPVATNVCLHSGHCTFLPSKLSGTWRCFLHSGQAINWDIVRFQIKPIK
jgi:hypothetical protein